MNYLQINGCFVSSYYLNVAVVSFFLDQIHVRNYLLEKKRIMSVFENQFYGASCTHPMCSVYDRMKCAGTPRMGCAT